MQYVLSLSPDLDRYQRLGFIWYKCVEKIPHRDETLKVSFPEVQILSIKAKNKQGGLSLACDTFSEAHLPLPCLIRSNHVNENFLFSVDFLLSESEIGRFISDKILKSKPKN